MRELTEEKLNLWSDEYNATTKHRLVKAPNQVVQDFLLNHTNLKRDNKSIVRLEMLGDGLIQVYTLETEQVTA